MGIKININKLSICSNNKIKSITIEIIKVYVSKNVILLILLFFMR